MRPSFSLRAWSWSKRMAVPSGRTRRYTRCSWSRPSFRCITAAKGRPYERQFDGEHDIPTVEGPILKDLESHADYPSEVADWYEMMAREVMRALEQTDAHQQVASDDALWSGPPPAAGGP